MQSFSSMYHKGVLECLRIANITQYAGKMSAKGQIAVEVTCEISSQRALFSAVLEEAGIYSCSPTDLKAGSKHQAFCSDYRESPSVEMIYCFPASHYSGGGGASPAEPFCTHLASLQFIFRQSCEWLSEQEGEKEHFSGNLPQGPENKL